MVTEIEDTVREAKRNDPSVAKSTRDEYLIPRWANRLLALFDLCASHSEDVSCDSLSPLDESAELMCKYFRAIDIEIDYPPITGPFKITFLMILKVRLWS